MKKALIVVAAIALVVWVISWFRTPEALITSGARPVVWNGNAGLGRLPDRAAEGERRVCEALHRDST